MFAYRSAWSKRLMLALIGSASILLTSPATSLGQEPTQDSVVGFGGMYDGLFPLPALQFSAGADVTSGPSGENPTGSARFLSSGPSLTVFTTSISCLSVTGNTATVAGPSDSTIDTRGFLKMTGS